jgi:hypothetical protein
VKRTLFLILAALAAVFAVLVAVDIISFEADRLVMIFGFAAAVLFVVLARTDPANGEAESGSVDHNPSDGMAQEPVIDLVAIQATPVGNDPVDAELQEMIDDDQMHEITALVDEPLPGDSQAEKTRPARANVVGTSTSGAITVAAGEGEPLARLELRLADYDDAALEQVVRESESVVIDEMVRTGQLTSTGELTEHDVASMVFIAYTSEELLAELRLRKALD